MPRKEFEGFTRLDASDVNTYLMDQSVMTFGSATARDAAIDTPVEGMAAYLNDSNILSLYDGSAWKNSLATTGGILQVVSTAKTNTFTTSSATFTGVTGLTATITPTSSTSKILILVQINFSLALNAGYGHFRLSGGNSGTYIGDADGSKIQAVFGGYSNASVEPVLIAGHITYLDSPNSTSAITYGVEARQASNGSVFVNRSAADNNSALSSRGASSITVMEVAA
jgi:hypothetical protein